VAAAHPEAWIVVDLGFGDAGKGTITDALVRRRKADLVVRFNGGPQAGHTVVAADGRCHTFAQFGAGTLCPGVGTHLAGPVALHPGGLLVEAERLRRLGAASPLEALTVDERCVVITPFQQAANRLRELLRGADRHGSCGVGFGEAVGDALAGTADTLRAAELGSAKVALRKLRAQQERKRAELGPAARSLADPLAGPERALLEDPSAPARALRLWRPFQRHVRLAGPDTLAARLRRSAAVVLEGAQGVLLDQTWGFAPHTTFSHCGFDAAERVLDEAGHAGRRTRMGVLRAYAVRHGAGPLPTQDRAWSAALPEPHNPEGPWQGAPRKGPLDLVLLRYALAVCRGVDALALTCLDELAAVPCPSVCVGYEPPPGLASSPPGQARLASVGSDGLLHRLLPGLPTDIAHRQALGELLRVVRPVLRTLPAAKRHGLVEVLEPEARAPVRIVSNGPGPQHKTWRMGSADSAFP